MSWIPLSWVGDNRGNKPFGRAVIKVYRQHDHRTTYRDGRQLRRLRRRHGCISRHINRTSHIRASQWLDDFNAFGDVKNYNGINDRQKAGSVRFALGGDAKIWYHTLPEASRQTFAAFTEAFNSFWVNGPRRPNLGYCYVGYHNTT